MTFGARSFKSLPLGPMHSSWAPPTSDGFGWAAALMGSPDLLPGSKKTGTLHHAEVGS